MTKMMSLITSVFLMLSVCAHAEDQKMGFDAGALGSYSNYSTNGQSTGGLGFGVRGGYNLNPTWQIGAEWTYQSTTPSVPPTVGWTSNLSTALVNVDYYLNNILSGLFVGAKAGMGFTSAGGVSASSVAFGGEAGYDYFFGRLSIGPQFNFVAVTAPSSGASSATVIQAFAAIKYWL